MIIEIFRPPSFQQAPLDLQGLARLTGKSFLYAATGRAALFHILRAFDIHDKLLMPVYVCDTLLEPLRRLGLEPVFYDLDPRDLNASLNSIAALAGKHSVRAVLVASMYGNPADLAAIERYCTEHELLCIDDAAQSFGAKLDGRFVGTFGDAGFFSFSPGKPTAGHMGAFFWTRAPYELRRTRHCLTHRARWWNFSVNRLHIYDRQPLRQPLRYLAGMLNRLNDIYHDELCDFERDILGGILTGLLAGDFAFRQHYMDMFAARFRSVSLFRIITALRGTPHNHKFVLCASNRDIAVQLITHLHRHSIYASNGYALLTTNLNALPNAQQMTGRIVEIPIEKDDTKMHYLFDTLASFCKGAS